MATQGSKAASRRTAGEVGQRRPPRLGGPPVNRQGIGSASRRWLFNSGATQRVASELALFACWAAGGVTLLFKCCSIAAPTRAPRHNSRPAPDRQCGI